MDLGSKGPSWGELAEQIAADIGLNEMRSPTLTKVVERGVRYIKVDETRQELVFDTRALVLGFIAAGIGDRDSVRYGNTASWFSDWLGTKTVASADLLSQQLSRPEDVFAGFSDGFRPVLSQTVRSLLEPARALASQTVGRDKFEARHLFGAMIDHGVIADQIRQLFKVDLGAADIADLKTILVDRIMATPEPGETREDWSKALALDGDKVTSASGDTLSSSAVMRDMADVKDAGSTAALNAVDTLLRRHKISGITSLGRRILELAATLYQSRTATAEISTTRLFFAILEVGSEIKSAPTTETAGLVALDQLSKTDSPFAEIRQIEPEYLSRLRRSPVDIQIIDASPNVVEVLRYASQQLSASFNHEGMIGADSLVAALFEQPDMNLANRLRAKSISLQALRSAMLDEMLKMDMSIHRVWASALAGIQKSVVDIEPLPLPPEEHKAVHEPSGGITYAQLGNDSPERANLDDKLGASDEARAFARVAAARHVVPPLAFGIFGDWGSGKSFFMRLMQDHVAKLSAKKADEAKGADLFHERIVQIRFNAWHYVENNLWASLVDYIFVELDRWLRMQDTGAPQNTLLDKLATARELTLGSAERLMAQRQMQKLAAERLASAEHELTMRRKTASATPRMFWKAVTDSFSETFKESDLKQAVSTLGFDQLATDAEALKLTLDSLRDESRRARVVSAGLLNRLLSTPSLLLIFLAIVATPPLLGWLHEVAKSSSWFGSITSQINVVILQAAAVITSLGGISAWILKGVRSAINQLEGYRGKLDDAVEEEIKKPREEVRKAEDELAKLAADVAEAKAVLASNSEQLAAATRNYETDTGQGRLLRFVRDRAGDGEYAKHLGLIATIRKDFTELSAMMEARDPAVQRDFKRQTEAHKKRVDELIATADKEKLLTSDETEKLRLSGEAPETTGTQSFERIILYIDDLDRCPPDKVVQVLQAVHLLLSFPLFVVVVAVDSRWVSRALESHYLNLLANGEKSSSQKIASSSDYLEKIFQVPYWVRPMTRDSSSALLVSLASPPIDTTETAEPKSGTDDKAETEDNTSNQKHIVDPNNEAAPVQTPDAGAGTEDLGNKTRIRTEAPDDPSKTSPKSIEQNDIGAATQSVARALALSPAEFAFMNDIAPWVGRTPRRALRFLNIYRVIKASLSEMEVTRLEEGGYYALMTQLAIVTGAPALHKTWTKKLGLADENLAPNDLEAQMKNACVSSPDRDLLLGAIATFHAATRTRTNPRADLKHYDEIARRYGFGR